MLLLHLIKRTIKKLPEIDLQCKESSGNEEDQNVPCDCVKGTVHDEGGEKDEAVKDNVKHLYDHPWEKEAPLICVGSVQQETAQDQGGKQRKNVSSQKTLS